MADDFEDCEFWLPPEFLTDDDFAVDFKQSKYVMNEYSLTDTQQYGLGSCSSGLNSGLTTPGDSVMSSTDSDSEEDDYITGLTRRMAHSTLDEITRNNKALGLSGSPKSPLCSALVGCGCQQPSRRCSLGVPSKALSPPGLGKDDVAWDLLPVATGKIGMFKMVEEGTRFFPTNNGPSQKPSHASVPLEQPRPNFGFLPNTSQLHYQQFQPTTFEHQRSHQVMKQGGSVWSQVKDGCGQMYHMNINQQIAQSRGRNVAGKPIGLSMSAWPTLQQAQPGSGMRAVFLGNPAAKRECAGTGVFLPRRIGSSPETRKKKPACSPVFLPDRVVQALNLNLEAMDAPPRYNGSATDNGAALKYGKKNLAMFQQRQNNARPHPVNQEVRLPPEWTY